MMQRIIAAGLLQLRLFFTALQFFTRLPIPRWVGFEPAWLQHAARYFPLVGALVAAGSAAVYAVSAWLWPAPVAALLATAASVYLTGAFHEDGFADVCDGLGGAASRERALEIMKDSRIGAFGAIGIGLMLALKCLLLAALPPALAIAALLLAHPASRLAATALIWCMDYAEHAGSKAKPLAQQMSTLEFAIACLSTLAIAVLLGAGHWLGWQAMAQGLVAGTLASVWLARLFRRRLGGYTGDCLGAVQQLSEVAIYLGILASLNLGAWHG